MFGQGNYSAGPLSAYGMFGYSTIKYTHQNHFLEGDPLFTADPISAIQFKAGALYDLGSAMSFLSMIPLIGKVGEQSKVFAPLMAILPRWPSCFALLGGETEPP